MSTTQPQTETEIHHLRLNDPYPLPALLRPKIRAQLRHKAATIRARLPPHPVPQFILEEVLTLAQHGPSNSNIQPWRMHIVTGAALKRLSEELLKTVKSGAKAVTVPLREEYRHYRSELGHQLYGPEGYNVSWTDNDASAKAQQRNYSFF